MATTIQKWGNSLGIRLPKAIAEQANLAQGALVEFDTTNGVLTIRPARRRPRSKKSLADMLAGYKGSYPHRGVFNDPPVGREML